MEYELIFKILVCVALVLIGYLFHRFTKGWITRRIKKREIEKFLSSKKVYTLTTFLLSTVKYIVYIVVVYMICKILDIPIDSFFIAIAGAGSVALGFGAQSLVKNIINGFFILIEDQYSVGDLVTIDDLVGTVEEIGIRTTKIRSYEGFLYTIPNGEINIIRNMTNANALVLINLPYEANADRAIEVLNDEMGKFSINGLTSQPVVDGIVSFDQHSFTVRIVAECEQGANYMIERMMRYKIKRRFEEENIPMPEIAHFIKGAS